jgi:hypothetical protein
MEPGIVTLAKIVGLLFVAISLIPFVFILAPGKSEEPGDPLAHTE